MNGLASLSVLALALSSTDSSSGPYPLVAVLDSARDICSISRDKAFADKAVKQDWIAAKPAADSWQAKYLAEFKDIGPGRTYTKQLAGRTLDLIIIDVSLFDTNTSSSCEVLDVDAPVRPDKRAIERWAGRPADRDMVAEVGDDLAEVADLAGTILSPGSAQAKDASEDLKPVLLDWQPGLRKKSQNMTITYFNPGSDHPLAKFKPGLVYSETVED